MSPKRHPVVATPLAVVLTMSWATFQTALAARSYGAVLRSLAQR